MIHLFEDRMGGCAVLVLLFCMVFMAAREDSCVIVQGAQYSVLDYGAVGDGTTDDAKAFTTAWAKACEDNGAATVLVPAGKTFLSSQVNLEGPCASNMHLQIDGNIVAPGKVWEQTNVEHWINIKGVKGLTIDGSGQIDGQGSVWWPCNDGNQKCPAAPDSLGILSSENVKLESLKFKDSPKKHITVGKSSWVQIHGLTITAPGDSPNTDGIHIEASTHVEVLNCNIGTGDDCISIGTGTADLNISSISCGPGHGISIGSLGENDSEATAEQIHVSSCQFHNTDNGVRVKTWQGGSGYARGITFQNLNFTEVKKPIVIDQYYCDSDPSGSCPNKTSAVQVSDVQYIGVTGTTTGKVAISLHCSLTVGCTDILMDTVDIKPATADAQVGATCTNAKGRIEGVVNPPVSCLT